VAYPIYLYFIHLERPWCCSSSDGANVGVGSSKLGVGMVMPFILLWVPWHAMLVHPRWGWEWSCHSSSYGSSVGGGSSKRRWGGVGIVIIKFSSKRCTNEGLPNYYYYYYYYYPRLGSASTLTPKKNQTNKQIIIIFKKNKNKNINY
jgi:hypothetical protein